MLEFELVLPCYNESKSLQSLVERAIEAAQQNGFTPHQFQLVLVENGSLDTSLEVMTALKQSVHGSWLKIVPVIKNHGYGYGLMCGLEATTAAIVGWSHADQQCDPQDAFHAYSVVRSSSPFVLCKGKRSGRNIQDRLVSRGFELLAFLILGLRTTEVNAQPKIFHRELLAQFKNPPKTFALDLYLLYQAQKAKMEIKTISVGFPPRIHGVSNWASNFLGRYKTILGMIRYMVSLLKAEGRA